MTRQYFKTIFGLSFVLPKELKENIKKRKVEIKPKFTIESTTVSAAEKGTIIHLILQRLVELELL